jgi:ferritin-like metal-binding protein YciE
MSEITTPRDLFLHELGDILWVEEKLESEVLPQLMEEAQDPELKKGLEAHLRATRGHVENLEQVFEKLGEEPKTEECVGFMGLRKEHDELSRETAFELVDLVVTGAAARTEHYEVAAYDGLIAMARGLDEKDVIPLLESNVKEDRETLHEIEKIARHLSKERAKETTGA